jgi:hypothetical protein
MFYHVKKWNKYLQKNKDTNYVAKIVLFVGNKIFFLISDMKSFKGNLDLPGGYIHRGEGLIDGLKREVKEETGLSLKNPIKLSHEDNITYYYGNLSPEKIKDIKLSPEHSGYKLLTPNQVQKGKYSITPNFLKAVEDAQVLKNKNKFDSIDLIQSTVLFSILILLVKGLYS